ncbi:hypothetical protein COHA_006812 [Chlorella ohadii]|uniref:Uncharacterized protein n=1 Tax=Chlorella ohadii TaxID=2649997 RepID=A0AAD5DM00_9CHLO|nr:hypothetical protein COHA_006812 [Chlorella ohadii]
MRKAVILALALLALVCAARAAPASRLFLTREEHVQNGARSGVREADAGHRRSLASAADPGSLGAPRTEAGQGGQRQLFHLTSARGLHTFSGGYTNGAHGGYYGSGSWKWGSELDR